MSSWFQNARIDRIFPSSSKVMTSMGAMVRVCSPSLVINEKWNAASFPAMRRV